MTFQTQLDEQIKAVAPITGISFVNHDDKTTWRINFKDEATQVEKDTAQAIIDSFDATQVEKDAAQAIIDSFDEATQVEKDAAQAIIDNFDMVVFEQAEAASENLEQLKQAADEEIAEELRMSGTGLKARAYQQAKQ